MIVTLLAFMAIGRPRILMLGNSHTANNDVGGMVEALLNSDGSPERANVTVVLGPFLEDLARDKAVQQTVGNGTWDVVILQGAKLSSPHNYHYSQDGAISLAKLATSQGARVLLFAEWPRQGWDEASYIRGIYGGDGFGQGWPDVLP